MEQIGDKKICMVCDKEIKETKIIKHKGVKKIVGIHTYVCMGSNQFRHKKCVPGSKKWKMKFPDNELGNLLYKYLNHKRRKNSMKDKKGKEEFGYVDLVMATKEINEVLALDPSIDLELSQEKLIEELKESYKLVLPDDKFSELVDNCWEFIGVKEKIINNEEEKEEGEMKKKERNKEKKSQVQEEGGKDEISRKKEDYKKEKDKGKSNSINEKIREFLKEKLKTEDIIEKVVKIYKAKGKDEKWAKKRACSKLNFVTKGK